MQVAAKRVANLIYLTHATPLKPHGTKPASLILGGRLSCVTLRVPLTAPIARSCRPSRRFGAPLKVNVRIINTCA